MSVRIAVDGNHEKHQSRITSDENHEIQDSG